MLTFKATKQLLLNKDEPPTQGCLGWCKPRQILPPGSCNKAENQLKMSEPDKHLTLAQKKRSNWTTTRPAPRSIAGILVQGRGYDHETGGTWYQDSLTPACNARDPAPRLQFHTVPPSGGISCSTVKGRDPSRPAISFHVPSSSCASKHKRAAV